MEGWSKALHLGLTVFDRVSTADVMHLTFAFITRMNITTNARPCPDKKPEERGGLIFPGGEQPSYVDSLITPM